MSVVTDKLSPEDLLEESHLSDPLDYPRKRASIACEICRSRKSRCDGARPKCKLCTELGANCVYREPTLKIDAGDKLILDRLSQIETILQQRLVYTPTATPSPHAAVGQASPVIFSEEMQARLAHANLINGARVFVTNTPNPVTNVSAMPKSHSTPALHLLDWPVIKDLASKSSDPQVLMQLEMARTPLDLIPQTSIHALRQDLHLYSRSFFDGVNNWYAIVNPNNWHECLRAADKLEFKDGTESCMVLLVGALGAAAHSGSISYVQRSNRPPGLEYFCHAYSILPKLTLRNNVSSVQCHILAAAYLLYLVRPLEAWNLLCQASVKLQLLLAHPNVIQSDVGELIERVYWNTLLIESDLLAELDLPHSGIVHFEDNMSLPKVFPFDATDNAERQGKDDLWYFSAEINLRRLLNRVSHTIYADAFKPERSRPDDFLNLVGPTANELDSQLDQWYESLPAGLKFTRDRAAARDDTQTVLRLRYFACRTIIFRPYVRVVLADRWMANKEDVLDACRICLDACIRQIEDIPAHHAGHLPYLWQGVLSITSQTLLLMGATLSRPLRKLLPPQKQVDAMIQGVILEVERLSHLAPSLQRCAEILREAEDRRIEQLRTS
ncbi:uncharacterized protein K489DRAFT_323867 [Dissoconium aciculare CBS 342.82]|jgi:hypothetical protein|uniref:Zn(2)-C6 fungal-type domain-containing protein n=1 Tax=Dissoconium aciculare CBS 342.82 TaxID=1314786 RepID=A0A6J3M174_9PEZI|nr:uncharacterized protein K489DRAFT_323867 [Dissoconium aciculare CBS 342.82]KAF1820672.1 hypothetical protein K489DRAFT_323867 [Dissoconium aciculare CBS 342.82]